MLASKKRTYYSSLEFVRNGGTSITPVSRVFAPFRDWEPKGASLIPSDESVED